MFGKSDLTKQRSLQYLVSRVGAIGGSTPDNLLGGALKMGRNMDVREPYLDGRGLMDCQSDSGQHVYRSNRRVVHGRPLSSTTLCSPSPGMHKEKREAMVLFPQTSIKCRKISRGISGSDGNPFAAPCY
jgi:hypothetical protein